MAKELKDFKSYMENPNNTAYDFLGFKKPILIF
jgi:hypothetical protein